jgi:predicted acylesterase/phospholipase RssA
VQRAISAHEARLADVTLRPRVGHIRWDEMRRADELIRAGRESALEAIDDIRRALDERAARPDARRADSAARP